MLTMLERMNNAHSVFWNSGEQAKADNSNYHRLVIDCANQLAKKKVCYCFTEEQKQAILKRLEKAYHISPIRIKVHIDSDIFYMEVV